MNEVWVHFSAGRSFLMSAELLLEQRTKVIIRPNITYSKSYKSL